MTSIFFRYGLTDSPSQVYNTSFRRWRFFPRLTSNQGDVVSSEVNKSNSTSRREYNQKWRENNRHRSTKYNATQLQKGKTRFETGECQRASEKKCSLCKEVKPAVEFYLSNTNRDGLHGWCKVCSDRRTVENGRKRLFGVTPEQFDEMLNSQNGRCAICNKPHSADKRSFAVDHDHKTGKVRGLLCSRCNLTLGQLEDNIELFQSAIIYLNLHGQ
jgi:hypothetical protein